MSHELRTPLTSVIGWTELLLRSPTLALEHRANIETINVCGNCLLKIVNDILDFSKIQEGKLKFDMVEFNMSHLVQTTSKSFAVLLSDNVKLITEISLPNVKYVRGDPSRLAQCINNLLSNAIKFTKTGLIKIECKEGETRGDEIQLKFEVSDTGIGMSEEVRKSLFQPFSQGDVSCSRSFGGTGLGLMITKQLIEIMKGDIKVESTPGQGTTFMWHVYLKQAEPPRESSSITLHSQSRPLNILLVEDNEFNKQLMSHMLATLRHSYSIASNGLEALEMSKDKRFDAILMDLQMPIMGGIEATQKIKRLGGPCALTPIIALTANADSNSQLDAFNAGFADFLTKPITLERLHAALTKHG